MSDDGNGSLTTKQEVLPPLRQEVSSTPDVSQLPQGAFGLAFLARARYRSEQKQFEGYRSLVRAKEELVLGMAALATATSAYIKAVERASNIDLLRDTASNQAYLELEQVREQRDAIAKRRVQADMMLDEQKLAHEMRMLEGQQRVEKMKSPPQSPTATKRPTTAELIQGVGKEIEEIERAFAEERAKLIKAFGGETNLPKEAQIRLGQFELMKNKLLNDAISELS